MPPKIVHYANRILAVRANHLHFSAVRAASQNILWCSKLQ